MEWNINSNFYVQDSQQSRSGKISRGYRYSSWNEDIGDVQLEYPAFKRFTETDNKPTFKFTSDQFFDIGDDGAWAFDSDEKWAIEMYSGDLPGGPGSNVNQHVGKFQTKQRPVSWNDGTNNTYRFLPAGFNGGMLLKDPEYLENFSYRQGGIIEPTGFDPTKDLYEKFYKKPVAGGVNPIGSYTQGDSISDVGFCNAGVQELINDDVGNITRIDTTTSRLYTEQENDVIYGCFGSALNLNGVQSENSMPYALNFNILEGECVSGSCNQILPGGQAFLDCAVYGLSNPFNSIFAAMGEGNPICPGGGCTNPFAESTLPPGYGGGVQGFNPVIPRSRAYGDYISSTYFKDNYDERKNFKPDQVFIGHYLARKIVDGECVTMLCPSKPGVENYCRALPDCNL